MRSLILSLLLVAPAVQAQAPAGWADFTKAFQSYADTDRVVGATALIMRDGKVLAQYNTGFADQKSGARVNDRTIFHWGSITKMLTAISILQLRDRGKLSLDDRVVRWVPELRQVHDEYGSIDDITIRMLLSHTAGFQAPTWPYGSGETWQPFEPTTWNQLVAMMPYQKLAFKPGEKYSYSNPAFIYLARIIESITGDPWESYVQKNIFLPLGLTRSYFRSTPYFMASDRSHNYDFVKDEKGNTQLIDNGAEFDTGITTPNGGWNAAASELARFTAFLTNRAATQPGIYDVVLSRKSLEEMWQPLNPMDVPAPADANAWQRWMGLSTFVMKRGDRIALGHTGSQAGFRAFLYFNPQTSTAIIAALNTANYAEDHSAQYTALRDQALALLW
jgi:CubicO group peptidase (beta-lactamase class C family)